MTMRLTDGELSRMRERADASYHLTGIPAYIAVATIDQARAWERRALTICDLRMLELARRRIAWLEAGGFA